MRHTSGIDLLRLYSRGENSGWNAMLKDCYKKRDINSLVKIHRELSIGMTELENKKLNNEKINIWFVRLLRSLEITGLRIGKQIWPNRLDTISPEEKAKLTIQEIKLLTAHKAERTQKIMGHFRKEAF